MRKHVKLIAACLIGFCVAGVLIAASANASVGADGSTAAVTANGNSVPGWARGPGGLNVRTGPGSGFSSLGTLAYNTQVSVVAFQNGQDVNGDSYWDVIFLRRPSRVPVRLLGLHCREHQSAGRPIRVHHGSRQGPARPSDLPPESVCGPEP